MEEQLRARSIGIILDGNRRWAKTNNKSKVEGHQAGYEKVKEVAEWAFNSGVETIYLYAFSTENWNRDPEEVAYLMKLFGWILENEVECYHKKGIRIKVCGERERFGEELQDLMRKAEEKTKDNMSGTIVFLLSYGGRREIVEAARKLLREGVSPESLSETEFEKRLWTYPLPAPDLIIRTGGEMRLSNFLTWQSAYSEFFFPKSYLPEFSKAEFSQILADYTSRDRRFGK